MKSRIANALIAPCEWVVYNSRFLLVPMFLGVIYQLTFFIFHTLQVAWGSLYVERLEGDTLELLTMVDAMMVGTVVWLIIAGSYLIYVKPKLYDFVNENVDERPSALDHLEPSILKKHISGSLVTISAVNLIKLMLENEAVSTNLWVMKVVIHIMFIISVVVFMKVSGGNHTKKEPAHAQH